MRIGESKKPEGFGRRTLMSSSPISGLKALNILLLRVIRPSAFSSFRSDDLSDREGQERGLMICMMMGYLYRLLNIFQKDAMIPMSEELFADTMIHSVSGQFRRLWNCFFQDEKLKR
jgi:hypothetical protein